jgi:hypothetical protein
LEDTVSIPLPRVRALVMLALPSGGQAVARRNAWAGMSADAARGRDRRQAESALAAADVRAYAQRGARDTGT